MKLARVFCSLQLVAQQKKSNLEVQGWVLVVVSKFDDGLCVAGQLNRCSSTSMLPLRFPGVGPRSPPVKTCFSIIWLGFTCFNQVKKR